MKFYTCKVRLNGNANNEVYKEALSAAEMMVLEHIHSNGPIGGGAQGTSVFSDIKPYEASKHKKGKPKPKPKTPVFLADGQIVIRNEKSERHYLDVTYGAKVVSAVLGPRGNPLPKEYVQQEFDQSTEAGEFGDFDMVEDEIVDIDPSTGKTAGEATAAKSSKATNDVLAELAG